MVLSLDAYPTMDMLTPSSTVPKGAIVTDPSSNIDDGQEVSHMIHLKLYLLSLNANLDAEILTLRTNTGPD